MEFALSLFNKVLTHNPITSSLKYYQYLAKLQEHLCFYVVGQTHNTGTSQK